MVKGKIPLGDATIVERRIPGLDGRRLTAVYPGYACRERSRADQPPQKNSSGHRPCDGSRWRPYPTRSLGLDVLACPHCGGRLTLIALIDDPGVVRRVLQHLGLPTEVPEARPARAPPLLDGAPRPDAPVVDGLA